MPTATPTPQSEVRAFVADLLQKDASLTPRLVTPLIKKKFDKGVWYPTLSNWFEELVPGYKPKPSARKKSEKGAKAPKAGKAPKTRRRPVKKAEKVVAAPKRVSGRPRGSAKRPGAAKPPAPAHRADNGRYLVEIGGEETTHAERDAALAAVNRFVAGGGDVGKVRVSRIVPVQLGVTVVEG